MSNRPNRPKSQARPGTPPRPSSARRRGGASASASSSRNKLLLALGGLIAVAAIVAIVVSSVAGGGDSTPAGVEQTRAVTITGASLPALPDSGADPAVGTAAPELRGQAFDGSPVAIVNDGRPKLVAFVAHWCPHCQREVPVITKWIQQNGMPQGVDLYAVATSTSADAPNYPPSKWLDREHWPIRTMADDAKYTAASAFGLTGFPYFVAINSSGKVVARTTGELPTAQLDQLIALARGSAS
jgi:thiol-disulfide isomerase/thioredoxin